MRAMIYLSLGALFALLAPLQLPTTHARTFSAASLRGACIWQEVKYPTTVGDQDAAGPATILASVNFDGNGAFTMDYDANINGTYSSTNSVSGVYSVDPTGHGSFMFTSPASGYVRTYDFRLSPNGRTIYSIAQSDGVSSVAERVSAGTCTF